MNLARAKTKEDKIHKHQAIMDSAESLFRQHKTLPTVATIAKNSEQAKGTVYLYFSSKEAIYLSLLMQHYQRWFQQISQTVEQNQSLGAMLNAFLQYPLGDEVFLNLANLSSPMLEPNVDDELLEQYYESFNQQSHGLAQLITAQFPSLNLALSLSLVSDSHALILGLWQQRNRQPESNFETSAKAALARLWKGYFAK